MANADTRQTCTKCRAKLPVVPGAAQRASADGKAHKLADEWGSGISLTAAIRAAAKSADERAEGSASDGGEEDFSAHALTLGISPDPVLVSAPRLAAPLRPAAPTSRNAKFSFVLGLFSVVPPVAVYAIRYGYKGRAEIRESEGRVKGRGLATAGLMLGWIGAAAFTCLFGLELYAHNHVGAAARNESAALENVHVVSEALVAYASTYQNGFPSTLNPLTQSSLRAADCNHAGLVTQNRVAGPFEGYTFRYKPVYPDNQHAPAISPKAAAANCVSGGASGYSLNADPVDPGKSGLRHFYADQTGIIHYSTGETAADKTSPSLR